MPAALKPQITVAVYPLSQEVSVATRFCPVLVKISLGTVNISILSILNTDIPSTLYYEFFKVFETEVNFFLVKSLDSVYTGQVCEY